MTQKKQQRRRFTEEFDAQAVKRLVEGGKGLSETATELGLTTAQLSVRLSNEVKN